VIVFIVECIVRIIVDYVCFYCRLYYFKFTLWLGRCNNIGYPYNKGDGVVFLVLKKMISSDFGCAALQGCRYITLDMTELVSCMQN
jgi:hypothetical protein